MVGPQDGDLDLINQKNTQV